MADGFHHLAMRAEDIMDRSSVEMDLAFQTRSPEIQMTLQTNESVARHFLDLALRSASERSVFLEVLAEERPELVPSLQPIPEVPSPFHENTLVRFEQRYQGLRVYGSTVFVELGPGAELVNLSVQVAKTEELRAAVPGEGLGAAGVPFLRTRRRLPWPWRPRIRRRSAATVRWISDVVDGADPHLLRGSPTLDRAIQDAELLLFRDPAGGRFRLCWFLPDVVAPTWSSRNPAQVEPDVPVGGWESAQYRRPIHDLVFDAVTGDLLIALATARAFEVPVLCTGIDEDGDTRTFDARQTPAGVELVDLPRAVSTYDFGLAPYTSDPEPQLGEPVQNPQPVWGGVNRAAVTAQAQAVIVHDFFQNVVQWRGVDGLGAPIITVINCADEYGRTEWPCAQWRKTRMICGQNTKAGRVVSWARHLDVIAHEYTHGVTEHAVKLDYRGEIGALDESLSDIFSILIVNHHAGRSDPIGWTWELGSGLGHSGGPLRDLSDPHRGTPWQPAHMSEWTTTSADHGGVHLLSGVHNRAAYLIMTARLSNGELAFPLEESARCFFYAIHGLPTNARFGDARQAMIDTVKRRFSANPALLAERLAVVASAYDAVGTT